jgi:hypothetical protein
VGSTLDPDNQSLLDIDTSSNRFCLVGLARGTDAGPLPNREVIFEYRSDGSIQKENAKRVAGDFASVDLTLTIEEDGTPVFGPTTVTSECRLKGKLQKAGTRSKARLKCELGEDLAAFGLNQTATREFLDNVEAAFPKAEQKHIKLNTSKGKFRITHNGEPDTGGLVSLRSCAPPG